MITAVDSSVLFDIFQTDSEFGDSSSSALRECGRRGRLVVCDVVLAELAAGFLRNPRLKSGWRICGSGSSP